MAWLSCSLLATFDQLFQDWDIWPSQIKAVPPHVVFNIFIWHAFEVDKFFPFPCVPIVYFICFYHQASFIQTCYFKILCPFVIRMDYQSNYLHYQCKGFYDALSCETWALHVLELAQFCLIAVIHIHYNDGMLSPSQSFPMSPCYVHFHSKCKSWNVCMMKFFFPLIPSNYWVSKTAPLQMIRKLNIVVMLFYSI